MIRVSARLSLEAIMDSAFALALLIVAVTTLAVVVLLSRKKSAKKFLNKSRQRVKLVQIDQISPDTKRLRYALPDPKMVLGLPVGKHFKVFCPNKVGVKPGEWNGRKDPEAESTWNFRRALHQADGGWLMQAQKSSANIRLQAAMTMLASSTW